VNGTAALHVALQLVGVQRDDEVISQALTFIATCNALSYAGAHPVFVDVDRDTMGMSPKALGGFWRSTPRSAKAVPGTRPPGGALRLACRCTRLACLAHRGNCGALQEWGIALVEDAAESLGSYVGQRHTGTFGRMATLSFNGNKVITTGGGGMIITDDEQLAKSAKHLTTTAKIPHPTSSCTTRWVTTTACPT
jgi:perosamine synthetase